MSGDFSGKVALVTGAGGGIGSVIAATLARRGATTVLHYRSSGESARAVASDLRDEGLSASTVQANLASKAAVRAMFHAVSEEQGRLDVLINNAGSFPGTPLVELTQKEWQEVIDSNLTSVQLCTQGAAQLMAEHGGGAIVNVASIEGIAPGPLHAHYASAKAGVLMHTRVAALELGPEAIRVNAVSPGLIWRDDLEEAWPEGVARYKESAPLGRLGKPEDVAEACAFLASDAAGWITGANLPVEGGILSRSVI